MAQVSMTVNGKAASGVVEGRTLLSAFLRDTLQLTGLTSAATPANAVPAWCM